MHAAAALPLHNTAGVICKLDLSGLLTGVSDFEGRSDADLQGCIFYSFIIFYKQKREEQHYG